MKEYSDFGYKYVSFLAVSFVSLSHIYDAHMGTAHMQLATNLVWRIWCGAVRCGAVRCGAVQSFSFASLVGPRRWRDDGAYREGVERVWQKSPPWGRLRLLRPFPEQRSRCTFSILPKNALLRLRSPQEYQQTTDERNLFGETARG